MQDYFFLYGIFGSFSACWTQKNHFGLLGTTKKQKRRPEKKKKRERENMEGSPVDSAPASVSSSSQTKKRDHAQLDDGVDELSPATKAAFSNLEARVTKIERLMESQASKPEAPCSSSSASAPAAGGKAAAPSATMVKSAKLKAAEARLKKAHEGHDFELMRGCHEALVKQTEIDAAQEAGDYDAAESAYFELKEIDDAIRSRG